MNMRQGVLWGELFDERGRFSALDSLNTSHREASENGADDLPFQAGADLLVFFSGCL